ncbi:arylsulfatase A-like enzyme [Defluviimonas denitrificans]|jgi:arylsulfatase A-like enzyme|uniref:Arylsulfatase A-like enzyme n=1 Tax=Albidovulum denitrificans TaxID=404881 RepID=A0A2S8RWB8_9RHOB|nr:sulfatase-like hydrolase/transferase [Defluviimonas denitrificans]PQV52851.1 arylsulfatase A-like enzyme [Defluviimonas denitrificans]
MTSEKRPNIVFIITDQQRVDTIAATGHPWMETPNIDRMVHEGTSFNDMYVPSPVCSASRASLFSGVYPHNSGVLRNDEPWVYTWVGELSKAGYHCVNIGKMHTYPVEDPFGFDERHVTENKDRTHPTVPFYLDNWDKAFLTAGVRKPGTDTYCLRDDYKQSLGAFEWEPPEALHSDVFVPQFACAWLDRWDGDAPFFLQIGIPGPHPPYDPPKRLFDHYLAKDNLPKPIREDIPNHINPVRLLRERHMASVLDAIVHLEDPSDEQMHRQRAAYYANCALIDEQVGEVFKALERRGVLEETIVIFTSDHGDCVNDHGLSQKWSMYEQAVKVPAIIWGPAWVQAGKTVDGLVSLMDWAPTILDLAGAHTPAFFEAISLQGHFDGSEGTVRKQVYSELARDAVVHASEFQIMLREGDWKLVYYVDHDEGLLFDLAADPREVNNLWDVPEHRALRDRLISDILKWRVHSALKTQGFPMHTGGTT